MTAERARRRELAKLVADGGVPVTATASVHPQEYGGAAAVHIVDVAVDPDYATNGWIYLEELLQK